MLTLGVHETPKHCNVNPVTAKLSLRQSNQEYNSIIRKTHLYLYQPEFVFCIKILGKLSS